MARRFLGVDQAEIEEALTALRGAHSFGDLERLVESMPILQTPAFHATLRQIYHQSPADFGGDSARAAFVALYDDLIYLLHRQSYSGICLQGKADPPPAPGRGPRPPALYEAVCGALAGYALPTRETKSLDPGRDREQLEEFLRDVRGSCPPLPEYRAEPGISWTLMAVTCPHCRETRLVGHVHALDLVQAPGLETPLRDGRFEDAGCPSCEEVCRDPVCVLLEDPPRSADPLTSLGCAIRLAPDVVVFRPPPGTPDRPELRRLLEMRFERQGSKNGWASKTDGITIHAVAYSSAELDRTIDRYLLSSEMPRSMTSTVEEIAGKLRTGQLSFADAESLLNRLSPVMADWPLMAASEQDMVGYEWHHITESLIAERVASVQEKPFHVRALLAINTATAYMSLYEFSAAEQSLDRADAIIAAAGPDEEPDIARVRVAAAHHRADLMDHLGERAAAELLRATNDQSAVLPVGGPYGELVRLDVYLRQGAEAAAGSGDIATALDILPGAVDELRRLSAGEQPADRAGQQVRALYTHRLCGALGNLAATLRQLADHLDAVREMHRPGPPRARLPVADPVASATLVDRLRPALWRWFPAGFSPDQVREAAIELLNEGISIAEEIGTWEFAAIQAHHLVLLLDKTGHDEAARDWARRTVEFSTRVGDHTRLAAAQAYLAEAALAAGKGEEALVHLAAAVLECVREAVGEGYRADGEFFEQPLADGVISAIAAGGRELTGILVLESMKAATMAATLVTGLPATPQADADLSLAVLAEEAHRAREQLRLDHIWAPGDEALLRELAAADARLAKLRLQQSLHSPDFIKWIGANDIYLTDERALARRLTHISPNSRYLGFFRIGPAVHAYLLGPAGSRMVELMAPEVIADLDPAARVALATRLLDPFSEELAGLGRADRLIISPDLTLLGLPFPAANVAGAPLCVRTTSSFVHGTGMLEALGDRRRPHYHTAAVLGGPARPDLPDLENARSEVLAMRNFFGDGPTLTGTNATIPALVAALSDVDVLHIACHAIASGATESGSRLMLAPDILAGDSGELSEDRVLAELPVPQGCLVNLSGCRTAHQERQVGPLLAGLVPAFLAKGAGGVLAALWPIEDRRATTFSAEFYRILRHQGNPAAALARCQEEAASGQLGEDMVTPLAWAGYVLYGL
jgi:CHAT domain-containing protein